MPKEPPVERPLGCSLDFIMQGDVRQCDLELIRGEEPTRAT